MKKKIIFLFDSPTSINSLQFVDYLLNRKEYSIETIAILDESISGNENIHRYFDKHYIIKSSLNLDDPCLMDFHEVSIKIQHEILDPTQTIVISYGEYTSLLAAKLREKFGIKGHNVRQSLPFRDKLLMKELVKNYVRVPNFLPFNKELYASDRENYLLELENKIATPYIIKPVNTASALGVKIVDNDKPHQYIDEALMEYQGQFEIEEYIDGELYHCEILYLNSKPILSLSSRFNRPVLDIANGYNIGSIPLLPEDDMFKRLSDFCISALSGSGIKNGITHTEVFLKKNNELCFLETACRVPGGRVIDSYIDVHNVNILNLDQRVKAELPINTPKLTTNTYSFWLVIPTKVGVINKFCIPKLHGKYNIDWNYSIGDTTNNANNFEDVLGTITVKNNNYSELVNDFNIMHDATFVEMQ